MRPSPPSKQWLLFQAIVLGLLLAALLFTFWLKQQASLGFAEAVDVTLPEPYDRLPYLAADKGYGIGIDLTLYPAAEVDAVVREIRSYGIRWIRQPFIWERIEPNPGQYEWEPYDAVLQVAGRHNLQVLAVLETTPAWARPANDNPYTPPEELHTFGDFAAELAGRYGGHIDAYQIWHEPNLSARWGDAYVEPPAYARLLREGAVSIRQADPSAIIFTAALAPTTEPGPLNLNEPAFLEALYEVNAQPWFDGVAAQAYGFWTGPDDRILNVDTLNFSRALLLRQQMVANGDGHKPIWITAFGWSSLPDDWQGAPSPVGSDRPEKQTTRTLEAMDRVRHEWPFVGPIFFPRWDTALLADDDPSIGLALNHNGKPAHLLTALQERGLQPTYATVGRYPATSPLIRYSGAWRHSAIGADIPREGEAAFVIPFEGTGIDLTVRRGAFKAFLYVEVDGQPANALHQDGNGNAYVVLYDPLAQVETIPLARHLSDGLHQLSVVADSGWYQWAIVDFIVHREADVRTLRLAQAALSIAGLLIAASLLRGVRHLPLENWLSSVRRRYLEMGDSPTLVVTVALALAFFIAPGSFLPLIALVALFVTLLLRPHHGLPLIAFSIPFFLVTRPLVGKHFSGVEIFTLTTALAMAVQVVVGALPMLPKVSLSEVGQWMKDAVKRFKPLDWGFLALVVLALIATLRAENYGVAMREWRVVIVESSLFYALLRLALSGHARQHSNSFERLLFRALDAFLLASLVLALLAIYQYLFTDHVIMAEGVRRVRAVYGSPNNLGLLLGRVIPVLFAYAILGQNQRRRLAYAAALIPCGVALYLTFSKGALFFGLPAALLATVVLAALWRLKEASRIALAALALSVIFAAAMVPLMGTERFQTTIDLGPGTTSFYRIKLWQSAARMMVEHPFTGVGPDNFLYKFRTRYILPEAWEEPNLSHPHNIFLDFGTRMGISGVVVIGWLLFFFARQVWRLLSRLRKADQRAAVMGIAGSMAAFLAHGLVDNSYFLVDLAFVFALSMAIVQSLYTASEAPANTTHQ